MWDRPIYEEFFRVVRDVNAGRPRNRQPRVLLGDPPIDWQHVRTAADLQEWSHGRSIFPAELITREVIAKHRRSRVIYGGLHLMRQNLQGENLIERLDRHAPGATFVVIGHPFANKLDGTESVNQIGPLVFYTRGSWDGASLLLASDVSVEDQRVGTVRETYTLEDGKLMVDTIRTGPAGTMKGRTAHEKVAR